VPVILCRPPRHPVVETRKFLPTGVASVGPAVRAPHHEIPAPPFPRDLPWINVAPLRMDKQRGRPVLVEFWDFCRVNSLRTLPYLKAWHERYEADGLRVIGVHTGGFPPARDPDAVRAAVARLGIPYPVVVDVRLEIWDFYGNEGWPARYLWDRDGALFSMHYGEGAYRETEREIQELLGVERPLLEPLRPEDAEGVLLPAQTADQPGAYAGPYEAGGVWAVLEGTGEVRVGGRAVTVDGPGCYPLVEHPHHTAGVLDLAVGPRVTCHATLFTPGVAAPNAGGPPAGG
jgi:thiol-disulfide isomerase/thioredoxin